METDLKVRRLSMGSCVGLIECIGVADEKV